MGCTASKAVFTANSPAELPPGQVPIWAYGEYQVAVPTLQISSRAIFLREGMIWKGRAPAPAKLEMPSRTLVFISDMESWRVTFGQGGVFKALYQSEPGKHWHQAQGTRMAPGTPAAAPSGAENAAAGDGGKVINISDDILLRYKEIQKKIDKLGDPGDEHDELESKIEYLTSQLEQAEKDVRKAKHDLKRALSIPGFNVDAPNPDTNAPRYQLYVKCQNSVVYAEKQQAKLDKELQDARALNVTVLAREAELESLTREEQQLLQLVFGGAYGSDKEQKLEQREAELIDQSTRVQAAKHSWQQAYDSLGRGFTSLKAAESNAKDVLNAAAGQYAKANFSQGAVATLRDQLFEAYHALSRTWFFLPNFRLPHLGGEHMAVLFDLGNNIFMEAPHPHRMQTVTTYITDIGARGARAQAWVGEVINKRIMDDYKRTTLALAETRDDLRKERKALITTMVAEKLGIDKSAVKGAAEEDDAGTSLAAKAHQEMDKEKLDMEQKLKDLESQLAAATAQLSKEKETASVPIPSTEELGLHASGVLIQSKEQHDNVEKEVADERKRQHDILMQRLRERRLANRKEMSKSVKKSAEVMRDNLSLERPTASPEAATLASELEASESGDTLELPAQ